MPTITPEHERALIEHACETSPSECCGILAGNDGAATHLYRITNTSANPHLYLMDPQQQLDVMLESRRHGRQLLAFYHSHPHGPAHPSSTDVRMAQQSGWLGEDIFYLVVSLANSDKPDIRAFHIMENGEVVEKPLAVQNPATS